MGVVVGSMAGVVVLAGAGVVDCVVVGATAGALDSAGPADGDELGVGVALRVPG